MNRKLIENLAEALETDNTSALRQIGREAKLDPEALLVAITEAAGIVHATGKDPRRSPFFEALLLVGKELDNPAIAWAIIERKRREEAKAAATKWR